MGTEKIKNARKQEKNKAKINKRAGRRERKKRRN
jgi:hypothetical protein